MRVIATILLLLMFGSCLAQKKEKPMGGMKAYRHYKKAYKENDPGELKKVLEESTRRSAGKFKTYFALMLAELYERSGDFSNAEQAYILAYESAKEVKPKPFKANFGNFSGTVYDSYDRLGYFYLRTGNFKKAEQLFLESKSIRESVFKKRSVHRIHPKVGMGSLSYRKGEFEKTHQLFQEAMKDLDRAMTIWYDYDNVTRLFLNDLAEICLMQGRSEEALDYINKLSISSSGIAKFGTRLGGRMEIARVFELKARYYLLEGDYDKAQEYLNRAQQFFTTKVANSDVKFKIQKTQALLYWQKKDIPKASESFLSLTSTYQQHIAQNFVSMSEYEKEQFYNTLKGDFNLFNAFAVDNSTGEQQQLYESMYNNALNTKALLLNGTNKIKNSIMQSGDQQLIEKFREWEQAKGQLSTYYFDKKGEAEIDQLEKKIGDLEKEINRESQLFNAAENPPTWQQVVKSLKPGEAAMELIRVNTVGKGKLNGYGKNSGLSDSTIYLAMILKADSRTPECLILAQGNQMEKRSLTFYRNSIFAHSEDKQSYDLFWLPIQKHLAGISRVFFSPDGVYNQLNLNTLRNPVNQQYVLDELELVYVTNTGDLLKQKKEQQVTNAVLIGRPTFDLENVDLKKIATQEGKEYGKRNVLTDELAEFKEQEFADLPGTETEISQIEQTLVARNVEVKSFKGVQALEENVKAVKSPVILHIATHGFFVDDSASYVNPMIRSGLVLAGVKNQEQTGTEDGILTAYEATNLNLEGTSLVALSACETGLGEVRNGEGVYGLQRAIIVAGAGNLLMSLWKVDDAATALLMIEMYKAWNGTNNQVAFREAQKLLRANYPDPFYWGAFIMLGK